MPIWVIFYKNELLTWTTQEKFATLDIIQQEDYNHDDCEIRKDVPGFDGTSSVRILEDGTTEVYKTAKANRD